jgi:hypothetical protein
MILKKIWPLSLIFIFSSLNAKQLNFGAGFYSLTSKSNVRKPVTISSTGSYRISYMQNIWKNICLNAGYNLILEKGISGDKSYGFSFGGNYYFGAEASIIKSKLDNISINYISSFLPYVGLEFHQRQIQSTKTSYAGFGFVIGAEKYWRENFSFHTEARLIQLGGSNKGEAEEKTLLAGVSLHF